MERRRGWQPTLLLFAALAAVARAYNASDFSLTGTFGYEYTTYNTQLLADLFADYDRFALANNANKSDVTWGASGTEVMLEIRIYSVQHVDTKSGSMELKVWMNMMWRDDRLRWNASDYGGADIMIVPATGDDRRPASGARSRPAAACGPPSPPTARSPSTRGHRLRPGNITTRSVGDDALIWTPDIIVYNGEGNAPVAPPGVRSSDARPAWKTYP